MVLVVVGTQEDDQAEMMRLLQSAENATNERQLNADLRAKIYEQTRLIAELRHDEVNRQQTVKARHADVVQNAVFFSAYSRDRRTLRMLITGHVT